MVNQLSTQTEPEERGARVQPSTAARTVEPGLLYIDGVWREASDGATAPTITPIDESEITTVAQATESDVEAAVAAARTAFDDGPWPGFNANARARVRRRIAELVEENLADLAYLESPEMDKPTPVARTIYTRMTGHVCQYHA